MSDLSDDEILEALELDTEPKKQGGRSHEEARVIAGFEDIVRFVDEHGRGPAPGEGKDIFERLYAVRLDRIRANPAHRALVADLDRHGLLAGASDQAQGEVRRPMIVVPRVDVKLDPSTDVWPASAPATRRFTVTLTHGAKDTTSGTVRLELPSGWPAVPPKRFELTREDERESYAFDLRIPAEFGVGADSVSDWFPGSSRKFSWHCPTRSSVSRATSRRRPPSGG